MFIITVYKERLTIHTKLNTIGSGTGFIIKYAKLNIASRVIGMRNIGAKKAKKVTVANQNVAVKNFTFLQVHFI